MSKRNAAIIAAYSLIVLFAISPLLPMLTVNAIGGEAVFGSMVTGGCWILHHFYLLTVPFASLILTLALGTHLQHRLAVRKIRQQTK